MSFMRRNGRSGYESVVSISAFRLLMPTLTLLTNARPKAISWPVSSATRRAFSRVYPPALMSARGNQSLRMNSFVCHADRQCEPYADSKQRQFTSSAAGIVSTFPETPISTRCR